MKKIKRQSNGLYRRDNSYIPPDALNVDYQEIVELTKDPQKMVVEDADDFGGLK